VDAAVDTVVTLLQSAVPLARIELLDRLTIDAVRRYSALDLPDAPMLFIELHAFSAVAVAEQLAAVREVVSDAGGSVHATATTEEERARLWDARHKTYFAGLALRPGARAWTTDVCVPISHLASAIRDVRRDLDACGMVAPLVGHVGDGNFHLLLLIDPANDVDLQRARAVNDRLVERALACGGTCTGEHGIGMGKMTSLQKQHGDLLPLMRAIKASFDPLNLLNPGKIFHSVEHSPH
jgi:D-lactate dehydrogenase (cytochrome)